MSAYEKAGLLFSIIFDACTIILIVDKHGLSGWQIFAVIAMVISIAALGMIRGKENK